MESRNGLFKSNPMLLYVLFCFSRVPIEQHYQYILKKEGLSNFEHIYIGVQILKHTILMLSSRCNLRERPSVD